MVGEMRCRLVGRSRRMYWRPGWVRLSVGVLSQVLSPELISITLNASAWPAVSKQKYQKVITKNVLASECQMSKWKRNEVYEWSVCVWDRVATCLFFVNLVSPVRKEWCVSHQVSAATMPVTVSLWHSLKARRVCICGSVCCKGKRVLGSRRGGSDAAQPVLLACF